MNRNIMRRRILGSRRVATPKFSPTPGPYQFGGRNFDVIVSCDTPDSVINCVATNNGVVIASVSSSPSPVTISIPASSVGYGETAILTAIAKKDSYESSEAQASYLNSDQPDDPRFELHACDDGYGNHYDNIYTGSTPYTPAYVKIYDPLESPDASIYYTFTENGSTPPDPTDPNTISRKVMSSGQSVQWDIDPDHPFTITQGGTYKIKASVHIANGWSNIISQTYTIGQSICKPVAIYHDDIPTTAGRYSAVDVDETTWNKGYIKNNHYVYVDYSDYISGGENYIGYVVGEYGFVICAPYDDDKYSSVRFTLNGDDPTTSASAESCYPNRFCTTNRNFRLKWKITKLGCTPKDNYSTTDEDGSIGIGKMLLLNRFVFKVNVTDVTKPILIGRKNVWPYKINTDNYQYVYGNNFGENILKSNLSGTGLSTFEFGYDTPDNESDVYVGGGSNVRVYVNGTRLRAADFSTRSQRIYLPSCPITNNGDTGNYMVQNDFTISEYTDDVFVWTPTQTGEFDFVYSYDEELYNGGKKEKCNSPIGFMSTQMRQGLLGNFDSSYSCPTDITVTNGMSFIPRFFFANMRWANSDQRFRFSSDPDNSIYTNLREVTSEDTITSIESYAFAGTRPRDGNDNSNVTIDFSKRKRIKTIGDYVFFDCVKNLNWDNPKQRIFALHIPHVESIGCFFNGYNCSSTCIDGNGVEKKDNVGSTMFIMEGSKPPKIGNFSRTDPGCHAQTWSNQTKRTYISGSGIDSDQWHSMAFSFVVWDKTTSPYKFHYNKRKNFEATFIKVPYGYVCIYDEYYRYQLGTDPKNFSDEKAVIINIVDSSDGFVCRNHHDSMNYPSDSVQGRFTYKDNYDPSVNVLEVNKVCFMKGNLTFQSHTVLHPWIPQDDQFSSQSQYNNKLHNENTKRDMFAFATSGIDHKYPTSPTYTTKKKMVVYLFKLSHNYIYKWMASRFISCTII